MRKKNPEIDIMQIVLLGAGALLLLQYFRNSSHSQPQPQSQAPNTQPVQQNAPPSSQQAPPPQSGTQQSQAPSDDSLMRAALYESDAALAGDYRLNWWQWNWYRTEGARQILGIENPDPAQYSPKLDDRLQVSPQQLMTAAEYHGLLHQFGLSGLSWSHWG